MGLLQQALNTNDKGGKGKLTSQATLSVPYHSSKSHESCRQERAKDNQGSPCTPRPLCAPVKSTDTVLQVTGKQKVPLSSTTLHSPLCCKYSMQISEAKNRVKQVSYETWRAERNMFTSWWHRLHVSSHTLTSHIPLHILELIIYSYS